MIYKILVSGRVQGVNFRNMTKQFAYKQGLSGTVRNLDDGRVEIFIGCSVEEKKALVAWLRSSPGFSRVEGVKIDKMGGGNDFEGFKIIREGGLMNDQVKSFRNFGRKILGKS